ncbi:hypothetical protein [Arthrobacter sp. Bz4]|uniref:hypothetical protein n=1 Tax=Arthrobacter sp. Bz4 TaxID=2171979 RepID=UPI000D50F9A9|nr:hypothetical protein [Arthrobacter sp. Bz4]PVE20097.1 hypothetical protein DDA93_01800 [Arthrobacter sp. Bz4]
MKPASHHPVFSTIGTIRAVSLFALSAGLWWGWFAWDTEYAVDPATGSVSGPYEAWQGGGCILAWAGLGWIGNRMLHPAAVVAIMPVAFTTAFAISAAPMDDSGLWIVGAILMIAGTSIFTALFVALLNWRTPAHAQTRPS